MVKFMNGGEKRTKKIHYSDLGLVNTKAMFAKAMKEKYAVPAYNFNNLEQLQAIVSGCVKTKSAVILQVSGSARKYIGTSFLPQMAAGARAMADEVEAEIPIALRAAASAVCKVNIDSDGRLAMTATIRKVFHENPGEFDPRKYLGPARDELISMIVHKNNEVLGSGGRY